ncbi:formyltransferase family protein [Candidatus Pelagibacter sp.]|nr:formyltransferase family protein [Candidatus Pelagibacter sp.]
MINLILSESKRSLTYLEKIIINKIKINKIILYSNKLGDVFRYVKKKKIIDKLIICKTNNINSSLINKNLKLNKSSYNIISTYPGEIVKNFSLLKKKLLHCHPGDLPKFKGSTTIYYSIILKQKICVTIFIMNKSIDSGKIIYKKYFNCPKNLITLEKNFDNKIRSLTLINFLKKKRNYKYRNFKDKFPPYYIAHPIIRQIILNKKYLKNT